MGERYEYASPSCFEVGLIEVEQGLGVLQYLAMRIAGAATVKNRRSC